MEKNFEQRIFGKIIDMFVGYIYMRDYLQFHLCRDIK